MEHVRAATEDNGGTPDKSGQLAERTMNFALSVVRLQGKLPRNPVGDVIGRQVLRSATSVGAQYREACRARTPAEFVSKLESSMQELEETGYWLELLQRSETLPATLIQPLAQECDEISRMMVASIRTVKSRNQLGRGKSSTQHSALSTQH